MKVTALIPDDLVSDVKQLTQGKNITDSLIKALSEWVSIQRIKSLNSKVSKTPLSFRDGFNAQSVREINRQ